MLDLTKNFYYMGKNEVHGRRKGSGATAPKNEEKTSITHTTPTNQYEKKPTGN